MVIHHSWSTFLWGQSSNIEYHRNTYPTTESTSLICFRFGVRRIGGRSHDLQKMKLVLERETQLLSISIFGIQWILSLDWSQVKIWNPMKCSIGVKSTHYPPVSRNLWTILYLLRLLNMMSSKNVYAFLVAINLSHWFLMIAVFFLLSQMNRAHIIIHKVHTFPNLTL